MRMGRTVLCGLVLSLLLCWIPGARAAERGDEGRAKVSWVSVGDSPESACHPRGRDFWIEEVRDVYVCVVWRGLAGTYVQRLTFVSPNGHVYQTLTVPFSTPGTPAPPESVEVEGQRHGVARSGKDGAGKTLVLARLPVAGTFITQHTLVGLWTVEVFLSDQPVGQGHFILLQRE